MNAALLKARLAALVTTYGETITYYADATRGTITIQAIVEVAPNQNLTQLAGVALGAASPGGVVVMGSGTPETYPTVALFLDPAAAILPLVGDVFARDNINVTVKELYTSRLANDALVLVAIAQH